MIGLAPIEQVALHVLIGGMSHGDDMPSPQRNIAVGLTVYANQLTMSMSLGLATYEDYPGYNDHLPLVDLRAGKLYPTESRSWSLGPVLAFTHGIGIEDDWNLTMLSLLLVASYH